MSIVSAANFQHVFKVSQLLNFDLIYIYHHIHEGAQVKLLKDEEFLDGKYTYSVYFKNFKIGSIIASSLFNALSGQVEVLVGQVVNITKEKYMPIKELDIVVRQSELRLVS